jgi:Firmicute plasmid replication protein (RepL)
MTEKTEEKQTRRGVELFSENPFLFEAAMKTRTRRVTNRRGDMMLVSSETGEITAPVAGFWEAEEVDSTRFIKLFVNGVKALKELTGAGTKVFEILYLAIQEQAVGTDQVMMSFSLINQNLTPCSSATYNRGMKELMGKRFLAATKTQGLFWINLDYVFNGDRLAFVKEYRKVERKKWETDLKDTKTIDMFQEQRREQVEGLESPRTGATRRAPRG